MALFSSNNPKEKQHSGIAGAISADVIKWEPGSDREASIIAHKYEYEDFPNGSYLIVAPSQMAVFTNNMNTGNSLGDGGTGAAQLTTFIGPCKIQLETGNSRFAPFRNISHALTGGESAFHSTVYFVNTTYMNDLDWGTQEAFQAEDPVKKIIVRVQAWGRYGAHIEQTDTSRAEVQARKFLQKVVGTRADYTRKELEDFMRGRIQHYVPELLAQQMIGENEENKKIGFLEINAYRTKLSAEIKKKLAEHFDEVGLTLDAFFFESISVPNEDISALKEAQNDFVGTIIKTEAEKYKQHTLGYTYQENRTFDVLEGMAKNEGPASGPMTATMGLGTGVVVGSVIGNGMRNMVQDTLQQVGPQQPSAPADQQTVAQATQQTFTQADQQTITPPPAASKICIHCKAASPADAEFCINCGESFRIAGAICPECKKELPPDAKFCPYCRHRIRCSCGKELMPGMKFCPSCGIEV